MTGRTGKTGTPVWEFAGGVLLRVRVQPRASRTELAGLHGDALKVRLAAPPVDNAANEELVRFLADLLAVPRRDVTIRSGHASRTKTVAITGTQIPPIALITQICLGQ